MKSDKLKQLIALAEQLETYGDDDNGTLAMRILSIKKDLNTLHREHPDGVWYHTLDAGTTDQETGKELTLTQRLSYVVVPVPKPVPEKKRQQQSDPTKFNFTYYHYIKNADNKLFPFLLNRFFSPSRIDVRANTKKDSSFLQWKENFEKKQNQID